MTNENNFLILEIYNKSLRNDLKRVLDLISLGKENVCNQRQYEIENNRLLTRIFNSNGDDVSLSKFN